MIIRGIEEHDLRAALDVANYAYCGNLRFREEPVLLSNDCLRWRVGLGVKDKRGPGCKRRVSLSCHIPLLRNKSSRDFSLACYHAHRDFLYAVFEREPSARVVTRLAAYYGLASFEATCWKVGKVNVDLYFGRRPFEDYCGCSKCPRIEAMRPDTYLGEYTLVADGKIYSGLGADVGRGKKK